MVSVRNSKYIFFDCNGLLNVENFELQKLISLLSCSLSSRDDFNERIPHKHFLNDECSRFYYGHIALAAELRNIFRSVTCVPN